MLRDDETTSYGPITRWYAERDDKVARWAVSFIATFFFGGMILARTLYLALGHGSITGAVAVDVVLGTLLFVVLAVAWVPDY
jgi:hypothetical protein